MPIFHGRTCKIHYNIDLSGDIVINTDKLRATEDEVKISIDDIIDFLAITAKERDLQKIEQKYQNKTNREILGL